MNFSFLSHLQSNERSQRAVVPGQTANTLHSYSTTLDLISEVIERRVFAT